MSGATRVLLLLLPPLRRSLSFALPLALSLAFAGAAGLVASETPPAATPPGLPSLPVGTLELHGSWDGQPFWARVLPPDAKFGGKRLMQLSWQPPKPEAVGGTRLIDCPFVLLDDQARVVAWNGRDTLTQAEPGTPDGYQVTREVEQGSGDAAKTVERRRIIHGPRGWDLQLAPLLLAMTWHDASSAQVPIVDLFGMRGDHQLALRWKDRSAEIAGQALLVEPAADGSCRRLLDASNGAVRLAVDGRTLGSPAP